MRRRRLAVILAVTATLCLGACGDGRTASQSAGGTPAATPSTPHGGTVSMNSVSLQFAEYHGDPRELAARVDQYLADARQDTLAGDPVALVVPHAGYVYSGPVAAYAYKGIQGKRYDTVVVVGPSHHYPFRGISVVDATSFETPLGSIPIDAKLVAQLRAASPEIVSIPAAHADEHSVEVQIPFLQRVLGKFSLVMAVYGNWSPAAEDAFVETLARARKTSRILLVASSDLSHYHDYRTARTLDDLGLGLIAKLDAQGLLQAAQRGECELCGLLPVHLAMGLAERTGARDVRLLHAASSGDTAGPKDQVVGYAAVAFLPDTKSASLERGALGSAEKKRLLEIARRTITEFVQSGRVSEISETDPLLQTKSGAFVTIQKNGQLRGCIGNFHSTDPLWRTVIAMAVAACSQDPRFPPMTAAELAQMHLEISVLSPMRKISDINEIEVGRHGLYLVKGFNSGTLLPQVAVDYGWDRMTFLQQTCRKAGLPPDAWKEGAEIYVYEAQVFGEGTD